MALLDAYIASGYSAASGSKASASKLALEPPIAARINELQSDPDFKHTAAVNLEVVHSKARVLTRLMVLSMQAQSEGKLAVSVRCEELLGRDLGMFKEDNSGIDWDGDVRKLSLKQQQMLRTSLEAMVRDGQSRAIETSSSVISEVEHAEDTTAAPVGAVRSGDDAGDAGFGGSPEGSRDRVSVTSHSGKDGAGLDIAAEDGGTEGRAGSEPNANSPDEDWFS